MTTKPEELARKIRHRHRWSRKYEGIFNGPVRVCLNGICGAMRLPSGHIVILRDGTKFRGHERGER